MILEKMICYSEMKFHMGNKLNYLSELSKKVTPTTYPTCFVTFLRFFEYFLLNKSFENFQQQIYLSKVSK